MQGVRATEVILMEEDIGPVESLPMDKVCQLQEKLIPSDVVEPQHYLRIIASSLLGPVGPAVERSSGQFLQLITEIIGHKPDDTIIARSHIVLLQHLEHHHARPPVERRATLYASLIGTILQRSELSALLLRVESPLYPRSHLGFKGGVVKDIRQRQQPIKPVRTTLP